MMFSHSGRRALFRSGTVLLAAAALAGVVAAADSTTKPTTYPAVISAGPATMPDYSAYKKSYHLRFANSKPVNFENLGSLHVNASINGGKTFAFDADTGSTGIVIGASDVPDVDYNAPHDQLLYSSSGNGFMGVRTPATVLFPDAVSSDGTPGKPSAKVPILASTMYFYKPGAVNKSGTKPATQRANPHPFMFGIGTGRGAETHQEYNPWTNLEEMQAGTMRRGYLITRDGITLGLTKEAVGTGWYFEKLNPHVWTSTTKPAPANPQLDWFSSTGWLEIDGKKLESSTMLMDTGLTNLMIELPDVEKNAEVPVGSKVTIYLLGGQLKYSFTVGDKQDPAAPRRVTYTHRDGNPMVNTGLRVLALYDYLYDADAGIQGLRPTTQHD